MVHQTYRVDYQETFALVAKVNTRSILSSCATNSVLGLQQLNIKNALLHEDLEEEIYMKIPPRFNVKESKRKGCRLTKAFYKLKQSPKACFARFSRFHFLGISKAMLTTPYYSNIMNSLSMLMIQQRLRMIRRK